MALHWKILIGLFLGVVWAIVSSFLGWSEFTINWIDPFGQMFIKLLTLIAVPLVLFSIINGISSLTDITKLGRLGAKTLGFYLFTTVSAVTIGLTLVNTIEPGNRIDEDKKQTMIANFEKTLEESKTAASLAEKKADADKMLEGSPLQLLVDMFVPSNIFKSFGDNRLMLQVIFFAIFFGLGLSLIDKEKARPVKQFIEGAGEVIIKLVGLIMKAAPFFVFCLLAGIMAKMAGNDPRLLIDIFSGLLLYAITVIIGLGILILFFYPTIITLFVKKLNYRTFFKGIGKAQIVAFSTSSSVATLPVTMECVKDNLGVSKDVTSFVLPVGATVNMDGTSLYQGITAVFLAQLFGHDLSFAQQLTIVFTATLASIGAPAVPSAGLVMLIIVLESVGLNGAWIALIFPIDRPLDMLRTVVNITGDATAASVIATSENELNYPSQETDN
ncbi:MAG: dicarboxylate/amino acid:cation symporter [Bacteroidetes bacterium]|nr:dicarboxylate/amino acid:cation symporter [Bacteroidota bacterium]